MHKTKATYKVQTLQPKTVRCTSLTAIHIVTEGEDNLNANTDALYKITPLEDT